MSQSTAVITDSSPSVKEAVVFAGRLGIEVGDFMTAIMRLIDEARDKAPRELHRNPDVTAELMERDI